MADICESCAQPIIKGRVIHLIPSRLEIALGRPMAVYHPKCAHAMGLFTDGELEAKESRARAAKGRAQVAANRAAFAKDLAARGGTQGGA